MGIKVGIEETFRDVERRTIDGAARADALTAAAKAVLAHEHRGAPSAMLAIHALRDAIIVTLADPTDTHAWLGLARRLRHAATAGDLPDLARLADRIEAASPLP